MRLKNIKAAAFLAAILCMGVMAPKLVQALDFTQSVSTSPVDGTVTAHTSNGAPAINGPIRIDMIIFSSSDNVNAHVLSLYDTAASTSSASLAQRWDIPVSTQVGPYTVTYPFHNPLLITSAAFSTNGGSVGAIKVNVIYR